MTASAVTEALESGELPGRVWIYSNYHCNLACSYCLTESSPRSERRELTAEQMLRDEALLVKAYLTNDAKNFWQDAKGELLYLELIMGALLLRAADPTRLEWQLGGWWTSRNDGMLH